MASRQIGARAKPNKDLKEKCYRAIYVGHYCVAQKFGFIPPVTDVTAWAAVTSYCSSSMKMMMQKANVAPGAIGQRADGTDTWTLEGKERTIKEIYDVWVEVMKVFDFIIGTGDQEWVGTMSALLTLSANFNRRLGEIRVPPTKIKVKKANGNVEVPLTAYGVTKRDLPYLEGISYAPHAKSASMNSLGLMTIAIGLATCDLKYATKWENAFKNCWSSLDYVDELCTMIRSMDVGASYLLEQLSTLCLYGVGRSNNKACIPFVGIIAAMEEGQELGTFKAGPTCTKEVIATLPATAAIKNIDSSGHGMWHVYHLMMERDLTMTGPDGTGKELGQLFTHAVLGTHKEDLSLVEWMTEKEPGEFMTRSDIGGSLKAEVGQKKAIPIVKYKFSRICKLSSSSGTSLLSGGAGQIQRQVVFGGRCTQDVTPEDAILSCLQEVQSTMAYRSRVTAGEKLSATVDKVAKKLQKAKNISWGSTDFYSYDKAQKGAAYGTKVPLVPKLGKRYFNGAI